MTDRLNKIFDKLIPCEVFADIGCDHGYIAKAMLDGGKCKKAIVSDISAKCLSKAENLLENYLKNGRAESVVSDGFNNLSKCDQALVAGMGGEEIAGIISVAKEQNKLPERLIIQPMKNCDKARYCAVRAGYRIDYDKVFKSGNKYYNLIVLTFGSDALTEEEAEFGRDNIKDLPQDFKDMIAESILKFERARDNVGVTEQVKKELDGKIEKLKKYV